MATGMAAGGFFALDRASGAGYSVSRTEGTHQMRQRIPVTPVPERPPDVEAFFSFNDVRKSPARDGYRPAHRLTDTCLTTGVHHYYDVGSVPPGRVGPRNDHVPFSRELSALPVGRKTDPNAGRRACSGVCSDHAHRQPAPAGGKAGSASVSRGFPRPQR